MSESNSIPNWDGHVQGVMAIDQTLFQTAAENSCPKIPKLLDTSDRLSKIVCSSKHKENF